MLPGLDHDHDRVVRVVRVVSSRFRVSISCFFELGDVIRYRIRINMRSDRRGVA